MSTSTPHAPLGARKISPLLSALCASKAVIMTIKQRWQMARVFYLNP
ncbi:MAG: hypothetical protein H6861_01435 [Rhodospirillales bacterium]|nr:hypothetical protein [Rhodospirillales bacterium]